MTTQVRMIGWGVIKIGGGATLFGQALDIEKHIDLSLTDTQGELKDKGVFDAIRQTLLLPESYTILGVYFQPWSTHYWHIVVEHPDIPFPEEGRMLPEVKPVYQRLEDRTHILLRIDIEA